MKNIPTSFASAAVAAAVSLITFAAMADDAYVSSTEVSSNGGEGSSVNIGYYMKETSRIEVDFQYPETPTTDVLFGAWGVPGSDANPGLRMAFWNTGGKFCFILDSGGYYNNLSTVNLDDERHTAVIDAPNRAFRLLAGDGTVEWSGNVASGRNVSGVATWPVVLFGCAKNAAGQGNQHTKARIYSVKIYETENGVETLVRDLVPCLKNDDVGFYDNTSGIFYHGQSTLGSLVCGGDNVKKIRDAYLETPSSNKSVEKRSFNTGYFMKTNSWLAVDFQWLGTPADLLFGPWDANAMLTTAFWINGGKFAFLYKPTGGYASYESSVARDNKRHTAIIDARDGSLRLLNRFGDVEWSQNTGSPAVNNAAWPIVLFGSTKTAAGAGDQFSYARIFSAKFYEGDDPNPVKDFVPYVKDGAPGFLETVGGVFTEVKGISAGGDVGHTKCSYIENDGTTSLNLGYLASMRSRIEVDFQSLDASAGKLVFGSWAAGSLRYAFWSDSSGNKFRFIFHGNSGNDPQYVTSLSYNKDRHTAVVDMNNQMMYYITGNTTNYSQQATAGTFSSGDVSTIPLSVWGYIAANGSAAMQAKARIFSVRIYEDEELIHEFLPYTDGTTNSLRDVITGQVATKVSATMAEPTISGMGADGEERWFARPQNVSIASSEPQTLKAAAAGKVLRYKWTCNGEAVSGGENGELTVSWRKANAPDVYAVTPVYSVGGAEIEGEAVSAMVEYLPLAFTIIVR